MVTHPMPEPIFKARHRRQVLGRSGVRRTPRVRRQLGGGPIRQSPGPVQPHAGPDLASNDAGVIVPGGTSVRQARVPRVAAKVCLLVNESEQWRSFSRPQATEQRLMFRFEVSANETFDDADHGRVIRFASEAERSVHQHQCGSMKQQPRRECIFFRSHQLLKSKERAVRVGAGIGCGLEHE